MPEESLLGIDAVRQLGQYASLVAEPSVVERVAGLVAGLVAEQVAGITKEKGPLVVS